MDIIEEANKIFNENFDNKVCFERAVFISWYCKLKSCKFCYMSTLNNNKMARRTKESVLAEVYLCKKLNWKLEFLSSGYNAYNFQELLELVKEVYKVYKEKIWLNVGVLNKEQLEILRPYVKGVNGSLETINEELHKEICPDKSIKEVEEFFKLAEGFRKSITIIIGLGETIEDFEKLKEFIIKYDVDRIVFYALNPHRNTIFKKGPSKEYYAEWIARARIAFPKIEIVAGSWVNRLNEISLLLRAGANSITKFPAIKLFNSEYSRKIEEEVKKANRILVSNLNSPVKLSNLNNKVSQYLEVMMKSKS